MINDRVAFQTEKRHLSTEDGFSEKPIPILTFWSVNADMSEEEVRTQIRDFGTKGFGGFFIHSRAGRMVDYLGPQWENLVRICLEEAEAVGLQAWLYDEDGWPSGFAGGLVMQDHPEYCIKRMGFGKELPVGAVLLAAYARQADAYVRCDLQAAEWVCYYEIDYHYADLMEPRAVDRFIQTTHEWYKERFSRYFGRTVPGIFTDEPQLSGSDYCWNDALKEAYTKEVGRDLLDDLWQLYLCEEESSFLRCTYLRMTSDLFRTTFVKKIAVWCEENGLLLTGHFANEDGLVNQVKTVGDVMSHYVGMQLPGIDHLGRRVTSPVLCRQIGSIGNQFDKNYLLSETFGCSGWNTSAKEYLWIWQYQAAHGLNVPCLHLSAYSMRGVRKRDYPLFFSYQNSWWDGMDGFNRALEKISSFIPRENVRNRVLVVSPIDAVAAATDKSHAAHLSAQYRVLLENLLDNQIDFDVGSPWVIEQAGRVEGDTICVGNAKYSLVMIAQTDCMSPRTEELLQAYHQGGGRLVQINEYANGLSASAPPFASEIPVIANRCRLLAKYFGSIGFERPLNVLRTDGTIAENLVVRCDDRFDRAIVWNGDENDRRDLCVVTRGRNRVCIWDFNTEEYVELPCSRYADGKTYTKILLEPYASTLLTWEAVQDMVEEYEEPRCRERLVNWQVRREDLNALTLDTGKFRINNDPWSDYVPVICTHRELYEYAAQNGGSCTAQYVFRVTVSDAFTRWDTMTLCVEDSADEICVNGQPVSVQTDRWYLDKCICEYDIGSMLKPGENEILVSYYIRATDGFTNTDGIFETERNRFFFEKEPESLYIRGDFDVVTTGKTAHYPRCHVVRGGHFTVAPSTEKTTADFTAQHAWFYRGRVTYTTTLPAADERTVLRFDDLQAPYAEIEINGVQVARLLSAPYVMDVTSHLICPENEIRVILYSSNRNLLGPHHHVSGELDFVGPDSFKGEKGWEDFVNSDVVDKNTWRDQYSFCPLRMGTVWKECGGFGR